LPLIVCLWLSGLWQPAITRKKRLTAPKNSTTKRVKAERSGQMARAYLLYSQAAALVPAERVVPFAPARLWNGRGGAPITAQGSGIIRCAGGPYAFRLSGIRF